MMRTFLAAQNRRKEGLLAEISHPSATQSLQTAIQTPPVPSLPVPTATSSTVTATIQRLDLPTPASRRVQRDASIGGSSLQLHDSSSRTEQLRPELRHCMDLKIPKYRMGEDIENELLRFEDIAKIWRWPESELACRLGRHRRPTVPWTRRGPTATMT